MALFLVAEMTLSDDVIKCHQNNAKDLSLVFRDRNNHRANIVKVQFALLKSDYACWIFSAKYQEQTVTYDPRTHSDFRTRIL